MAHCDYVSCIVPLFHRNYIHGGVQTRYGTFNDYKMEKIDYKILERLRVEGSGSSSVSIRTVDSFDFFGSHSKDDNAVDRLLRYAAFLPDDYLNSMCAGTGCPPEYEGGHFFIEIKGNVSKFFQGQSIYSCDNHNGLIVDFILACVKAFGLIPLATDVARWRTGIIYPLELHYAENWRLDDEHVADSFIHSIVKMASINGRGFRFDHNEKKCGFTAVHAVKGELERFSFYNKYYDLVQNKYGKPKFEDDDLNKRIVNEAKGVVRAENKVKSKWFRRKKIMTFYELWKLYPCPSDLLYDKLKSIKMGGSNMLKANLDKLRYDLPLHILPTYLMWLDGHTAHEIKVVIGRGSRTKAGDKKYYKDSCYLRDNHGVNMKVRITNSEKVKTNHDNVVPLVRILEAKPCEPPQWMFDEGLIYKPSEHLLRAV